MRTASPLIVALAVIVIVFSAIASAQTAGPPAPSGQTSASSSGNVRSGKELYVKYSCYACHGYDGHGGAGPRIVPMRMNLPGFTAYVHNPRQMPPYTSKVLSDVQLADLFAYIKSLPESPAARDIPLLVRIIGEK